MKTRRYKLTGIKQSKQEEDRDFYVDYDVYRNILVVFVNDVVFEEGDAIYIRTDEYQKDLIKEYKVNNKGKTK
jgi:uncharacterized membrane-anchored protein